MDTSVASCKVLSQYLLANKRSQKFAVSSGFEDWVSNWRHLKYQLEALTAPLQHFVSQLFTKKGCFTSSCHEYSVNMCYILLCLLCIDMILWIPHPASSTKCLKNTLIQDLFWIRTCQAYLICNGGRILCMCVYVLSSISTYCFSNYACQWGWSCISWQLCGDGKPSQHMAAVYF